VGELAALTPALQRRILRHAAVRLGFALDFPATEDLRQLAESGHAGQKAELAGGLRGERTHRELRLSVHPPGKAGESASEVTFQVPGHLTLPALGLQIRIETPSPGAATFRGWKPGDRVQLRYSSGPRKVKEVLERMKVNGAARSTWPVIEIAGRIVWMLGAALEPEAGLRINVDSIAGDPSSVGPLPAHHSPSNG
jgi:tRNA(Ile)-lysidine synthase